LIIVNLKGGLGNQLFQYAAARMLSVHHKTSLKLDTSHFEIAKLRTYCLKYFCIQENFATPKEIGALKWTSRYALTRSNFLGKPFRVIERNFRRSILYEGRLRPYNPNILKTPTDVYLDGYWQSERYFANIENVIRREFTFKSQPKSKNEEIAREISKSNSVSIHVRRGDFVLERKNRMFYTCGTGYYEDCIALIKEKVQNPRFFVFSDDFSWPKQNLRLAYPTTFVTHNDATAVHEDLQLMSLCKHNIIANSTLSWWGAWLNMNTDKIVLAPKKWFNYPRFDTRDLLPQDWIKM
jgi:hypothetical protein